MTFAPLQTIAMRNVQPRLAGAASGIINTTRQLGSVIGSAAVGALLQSQLSSKLGAAAQDQVNGPLAGVIPPAQHDQFVQGFKNAASAGLEVTGKPATPAWITHLPAQIQHDLAVASKAIFDAGFTNGMRVALILPISVMGLAALSVLLVKPPKQTATAATAPASAVSSEPSYVD
jgi:hypothetical protein